MNTGYLVCQICESYHDSVEELNAHYERDHPTGSGAEKNSQCKFCEKSFTNASSMYRHQRKVHGRESASKKRHQFQGNFPCSVCGKKLSTAYWLRHHMKAKHNVQE